MGKALAEINPNTNLPALPEGYYWHVSYSDEQWGTYVIVRLMQKRFKRNGKPKRPTSMRSNSYHLAEILDKPERWGDDPRDAVANAIKKLADLTYKDYEDMLKMAELEAVTRTLTGDYPPNKLIIEKEIEGELLH